MRVSKKSSKVASDLRVSSGTKVLDIRSTDKKKLSHVDDFHTSDEKRVIDDWTEDIDAGPMIPMDSESDDFEFLPMSLSTILPSSESNNYLSYPEPFSTAAVLYLEADNRDKIASESWFNMKESSENYCDNDQCTTKLNWFDLIDSSFFGLPCAEIADIGIDITTPADLGFWMSNKDTYHADHMSTEDAIMTEMDIIGLPDLENWFDVVERRFDEELASFQMGTVH